MKGIKLAILSCVMLAGCAQPYPSEPQRIVYVSPNPVSSVPVPARNLPQYSAHYDTQADYKYWTVIEDGYGMREHMGVNRGVMHPTRYWDKDERIPPRW